MSRLGRKLCIACQAEVCNHFATRLDRDDLHVAASALDVERIAASESEDLDPFPSVIEFHHATLIPSMSHTLSTSASAIVLFGIRVSLPSLTHRRIVGSGIPYSPAISGVVP